MSLGEDLVRVGDPPLDAGHAQPARPRIDRRARAGRLGRRRTRATLSRSRAQATPRLLGPKRLAPGPWRWRARISRCSQRDGTVGTPSTFTRAGEIDRRARRGSARNRARQARCAAQAWESPSFARIGRLSQGPASCGRGQTPSFRQPRMTTSGCCRRASSGPQMKRRGWADARGRTTSSRDQAAIEGRIVRGGDVQARSPPSISSASRTVKASPASPSPQMRRGAALIARQSLGNRGMGFGKLRGALRCAPSAESETSGANAASRSAISCSAASLLIARLRLRRRDGSMARRRRARPAHRPGPRRHRRRGKRRVQARAPQS